MPNKIPAFPFYPKDWLTDELVISMTRDERSMYFDLLCHMWTHSRDQCSIENDHAHISRVLGEPVAKVDAMMKLIQHPGRTKFAEKKGKYISRKLQKVRRELVRRSKANKERATKAANARWSKNAPSKGQARPSNAKSSLSSSSSSASSSASSGGKEGEEDHAPVHRSGGTEELLAATYQTANPGVISNDKAKAQVRFHLARGVDPKAMESALFSSAGKKIWEVLDGLEGKGGKPKQASVQDMMQELDERDMAKETKDFFTEPK